MYLRTTTRGLAMLTLSVLLAHDACAEDLLHVYRAAVENDPVLAASQHRVETEQSRRRQAAAALGPSLNVQGSVNEQRGDASFGSGTQPEFREVDGHSWSLQLGQPLFHYQNWQTYAQSKLQVLRAHSEHAKASQDLILRVAQAYFGVLIALADADATAAERVAVSEQLRYAKRNYDVRTGTVTDVHEAQSRFDLVNARYFAALEELEVKRGALEQLTGRAPQTLARLKRDAKLTLPEPADMALWIDAAKNNNLGVRASLAAVDIAERDIVKARAGHYPVLSLTAAYGNNTASGSLNSPADLESDVDSRQLGVQLTLPLFASGGIRARVGEARAARDKARAELEAVRRTAAQNVRQAYYGVTAGIERVESLEHAVQASRSAVEGNKIGYRIGTRINIDVLNAQQQLAAAERELARARYETLLHSLRLEAAAGSLSERDIHAANALLDDTP